MGHTGPGTGRPGPHAPLLDTTPHLGDIQGTGRITAGVVHPAFERTGLVQLHRPQVWGRGLILCDLVYIVEGALRYHPFCGSYHWLMFNHLLHSSPPQIFG